ncbi:peptide ABC transporter substrate-binding protein [Mesobacillus selenatarsenatis]|uniref:Oligopeptide ABC transporter, periplasmic oligopeptide-binding protein OppA n=1 Tax=Mesobacillus selenatarsenatis (strain DSM 18680 / JCM 14380 / FERM P-15431 / SF-1) TaxID=1321606 RepID=A0A0A8X9G7_MESS1|nr:peptide ABC transporter substrate-binding protein [Mesobacillus selenatarsenatis]GAM16573.1 oligopeptide ABC transporter, periplasmic oligopeptide-binding protein OppA [Mesobacillus selenatarsenatis SF-1]
MKKSKFSFLLILTLVFSLILSACNSGDDNAGDKEPADKDDATGEEVANVPQELNMLDSSEIPTMDSVLAEGSTSFTYINNVGEGLYRLDQDHKPVPALAEGEPEISEDQKVYTFKLRDSKWSNGEPVTAHDFVFAWRRAIDPATASPYGPYMMGGKIKGAAEITEAGAAKKEYNVEDLGVKAIDDKTLEVTLEKPVVYWEDLFAFPTFYPQNEKFVTEKGDAFASNAENLLYNGPFKMEKWEGTDATEWVLVKNPDYHSADDVTLEKITVNVVKDSNSAVNAFEAGETDMTGLLSSDIVPSYEGDERMLTWMEPVVFWIKMNQKNEALANVNIRKAIAMGFNKEDLAKSILNNGSIAANFFVPKDFVTGPNGEDFREKHGDLIVFNAEEAKKHWETGLKELGVDKLEIRYLGGDTEAAKKTDAYIKNQLETNLPGLTVKLESVPFAVRLERDNAMDYDLQFAGWGPDYGNALSFTDLWITDGGSNRMGYSNSKYDELIKAAQGELATDPEKNWEAQQEAERIMLEEDAGLAPVYQRSANILLNPGVKGLAIYNYGPDYNFQWVKITEAE